MSNPEGGNSSNFNAFSGQFAEVDKAFADFDKQHRSNSNNQQSGLDKPNSFSSQFSEVDKVVDADRAHQAHLDEEIRKHRAIYGEPSMIYKDKPSRDKK